MKYTKKDLGSYNLHLIHTDRLKTITIKVVFHTPIHKEEIMKRVILSDILLQSTNKYNSKRLLTIEAEELYAASVGIGCQRIGNYIHTNFILEVLQDKYTEEGNLEKSIEFLKEIIFNPDLKEKAFQKEKLDLSKYNSVVAIQSLKEEPSTYAMIRLLESYDNKSPISYRMTGYIEDLEKINEKNLYETYQQMIDRDFVDIYVVGNFVEKEMISLIKQYFKIKKIKKPKDNYFLPYKKIRHKRLVLKEEIDNTQSKLAIACPYKKISPYERDYVLVLANLILGGGADSKLFKDVREKHSLCYSIHSSINKLDNLVVITAGIDRVNFHKTVNLITKNLNEMKKGHFTKSDIEKAQEYYKSALLEIEENAGRILSEIMSEDILKMDSIEGRIERMASVKKSDIVKVCKKIQIDTVFLLEGVKNEDN